MFLFIMHLFLMLAVPLGLSGFFQLRSALAQAQEELTEPTKLAGNSESAMQVSWRPAGWQRKEKFVLVLAPHLSYGIAYECTCMLLEGSDQEGAPRAVLHPLPSSRTT